MLHTRFALPATLWASVLVVELLRLLTLQGIEHFIKCCGQSAGLLQSTALGAHIQAEVIVAGCLAVLLAVVAWPFMKYAVAVFGGLAYVGLDDAGFDVVDISDATAASFIEAYNQQFAHNRQFVPCLLV